MLKQIICYLYMNMKDKIDITPAIYVALMIIVFVLAI